MTISADYAPNIDLGNGTTRAFAVNFPFADPSDLDVTVFDMGAGADIAPPPALNGTGLYDYTVTGTPNDPGTGIYPNGTVTFNTAPPGNTKVIRCRSTPELQEVALIDNARFPAKAVEGGLDHLELQIQEIESIASRAIVAPVSDGPVDLTLPPAEVRADTVLTFDDAGNIANPGLDAGAIEAAIAAILAGAMPAAPNAGWAKTLAAAQALYVASVVIADGFVLQVACRNTIGDGYGGTFVYDIADSTSTFTLSGLGFVDGAGRRWRRVFAGGNNVKWWGTDSAAVAAAVTATGAGRLEFPPGLYTIGQLQLHSNATYIGTGGGFNSVVIQLTGDVDGFSCANGVITEHVYIKGLHFRAGTPGQGCAIGNRRDPNAYISTWTIEDNVFEANLKECIYGNFLLTVIRRNIVGYYGTPSTQHRHIFLQGTPSLMPNRNTLEQNRFYQSMGCRAAISVDNGFGLTLQGNNIEANNNTIAPVELRGVWPVLSIGDHIEQNAGTYTGFHIADDIQGIGSSTYVMQLLGDWVTAKAGARAVIGAFGAASVGVDSSGGTFADVPLYYQEDFASYVGIKERGFNHFVNEGFAALAPRTEAGGSYRWLSDGVKYVQVDGATTASPDSAALWAGRQAALSTNSTPGIAAGGVFYVLNYTYVAGGQAVWKFERAGSTHLNIAANWFNALDGSSRTWAVDFTYDLTGASGWTNVFSVVGTAGPSPNGTGLAAFKNNPAMLIRWRQTAGDDGNSRTQYVGLQSISFQNIVLIDPPAFAA